MIPKEHCKKIYKKRYRMFKRVTFHEQISNHNFILHQNLNFLVCRLQQNTQTFEIKNKILVPYNPSSKIEHYQCLTIFVTFY